MIKGAEQEHIKEFELYLARCGLWIGTILGQRWMAVHKPTRTQVQTRLHIEKWLLNIYVQKTTYETTFKEEGQGKYKISLFHVFDTILCPL